LKTGFSQSRKEPVSARIIERILCLVEAGRQAVSPLAQNQRPKAGRPAGEWLAGKNRLFENFPCRKIELRAGRKNVAGNEPARIKFRQVKRRKMYINGVAPYFKNLPARNITEQNCDRWVKERRTILASETLVHELDVLNAGD
jgi:hypothetical protein